MRRYLYPLALLALLAVFSDDPARAGLSFRHPQLNLSDPVYTVCRATADCTVVNPPCGAPIAVNKVHEDEVNSWYDSLRPSLKCADWIKLPYVKGISCVKNRCAAELTDEPVDPSPYVKDPGYCEKNEDCTTVVLPEDCCDKHFVNQQSAAGLHKKLYNNRFTRMCRTIDRRHVKNLRCENNRCAGDLEVPLELPGSLMKMRGQCEQ